MAFFEAYETSILIIEVSVPTLNNFNDPFLLFKIFLSKKILLLLIFVGSNLYLSIAFEFD